jgi:nucleoside-diphosphate-sugar epimerase
MSRSNAIAAGILAVVESLPFDTAVRRVQTATGESEIKLEPLNVVRAALGGERKLHNDGALGSVLITGASGFLGSTVCRHLDDAVRVVAPPRAQLDLEQGSTALDLIVGQHDVDGILHLGNPRVFTSNAALGRTLTMLRNVLDVCLSRNVWLIYLSGWEIYSGYAGRLLADEATPALPRGPYGETKFLAEILIDHYRRTTPLRCAVLRSGPVYGPGGEKPRFLYNFVDKARRGDPIRTHRYRNGRPELDLMHVDDLVAAIAATLRQPFQGALNVGTGVATSTLAIATMLKTIIGSGSVIEEVAIDTDVASIAMDARQAYARLRWQPRIELERGLRQVCGEFMEGQGEG